MAKSKVLTPKEKRFVEAYCGRARFNATKAAREAGYSPTNAGRYGSRLARRPRVKRAIVKRLERMAITDAEIEARMAEFARGSVAPFLSVDSEGETVVSLSTRTAQRALHLVRKVKARKQIRKDRDGSEIVDRTIDLELHDAKDATAQLARMRGMYSERDRGSAEHGPTVKVYVGVDPDAAL
jgi:phage terminase small subunit